MRFSPTHRIGRRAWDPEDVEKYVGPFRGTRLTYATDPTLRRWAASGGSTTAILLHLLETGEIDGAMVVRGWVDDAGRLQADFEIATTRDELFAAQGSKYQAVRFGNRELGMIAAFPGRLAAVLLPCDATKLAGARRRNPEVDDRVALVISLYCGHNSEPELAQAVADRLGEGRGQLTRFHYRSGHWRGVLTAEYSDGSTIERPHSEYGNYRNLYFLAQPKCNHCFDHFGYDCDMSVGDIWTLQMREHPIKHTAIITRTDRAEAALRACQEAGSLHVEGTDIRDILDGQSRTLPTHYNVSARSLVGRVLGLSIRDAVKERVGIIDRIVAFIILANQRVSRTPRGQRLIFKAPKPVIRAYLLVLKALEQV